MKYFLIFFISICSFAQKPNGGFLQFNFKADYVPAKVRFVDGHTEEGFIYGFIENRKFEINLDLGLGPQSLEKDLNLDDKVFDFKNDINGPKRKLTIKDINEVILVGDGANFTIYRLFNIKRANNKGEIIDANKKIWLPLIKKGVVNIYGYDIYRKASANDQGEGVYMFTMVYLQKENQDYAMSTIDYDNISIFNMGKVDDKSAAVLKEAFKDCPKFVATIDQKVKLSKEEKKDMRKEYFTDQKELKNLKKGKSQAEYNEIERDYYHKKLVAPFDKLIDEYVATCPK
jgi:hypothetical protein